MTPSRSVTRRPGARVLAGLMLAALSCAALAAAASPARTLRYTILSNNTPAGHEVDRFDERGVLDADYEFNDRGRGPKIHGRYEFSADGLPLRVAISGVNYLKAPVEETLGVMSQGFSWNSHTEHGTSRTRGYYLSNEGVGPAELAGLARALLQRADHTLPLLPAGRASLEPVTETTVESHGETLHVREFAITGLDFLPATVWLDDQGDLFGLPGPWSGELREGWEDTNASLYALQVKAETERLQSLAKTLARTPGHPLAFTHVAVFDAEAGALVRDQTVVVDGDRIQTVGPASKVKVPAGAERIDGHGRTLLPGLVDMHVHLQAGDGLMHIASGVTAVRDLGNDIDSVQRLQDAWQRGETIGPRVWKAGLIDGPGPYQAPTGLFVETPEQTEAAVGRYAAAGYGQIKLYSSLKPELVPVAIAAAHRHGLRISGHVPQGLRAAEFVRLGADELQHINFVLLNFLGDKVKDTRTPERFTAIGEYASGIDLDSAEVKAFIADLAARKVPVDVTLDAFEPMLTGRPGTASPDFAPILDRLPAQVRRQAYAGGLPVTVNNDQRYRDAFQTALRMTRRLEDGGVPILVGTDSLAGLMLHRELELHVAAGIPAGRVLQDATIQAARILKADADIGSIRAGKRADLLLVEGDPVARISDIRRGRLVVKNGVVFDPARLYAALGVGPAP